MSGYFNISKRPLWYWFPAFLWFRSALVNTREERVQCVAGIFVEDNSRQASSTSDAVLQSKEARTTSIWIGGGGGAGGAGARGGSEERNVSAFRLFR
jgi:hypothetical protein